MNDRNFEFFKMILFIYLILAILGLHCCAGFSLVVVSRGLLSNFIVSSLVVERGLQGTRASVVVAPQL